LFIAAQFVFAYFCIAGVFPGELAWVQQLTSNLPAAVAGTLRSTEPSQTSPSLDLYIYVLKPNNGTAEDPAVVMVFDRTVQQVDARGTAEVRVNVQLRPPSGADKSYPPASSEPE